MGVVIRLRQEHLDSMIRHALEDAPIECCGLLASKDGVVQAVHRARNVEQSPYRFKVDPLETKRLLDSIEEAGFDHIGFYHSHTGSEPRPSPTDIRMMGPWYGPPHIHFVVGVADREHPIVRVFQIANDEAMEHEYELTSE